MPQKKWTEEQKKAASERMKANYAARMARAAAEKAAVEAVAKELDEDNIFEPEIEVTEQAAPAVVEPATTNALRDTAVTNAPEQNTEELLRHALEAINNLTGQLNQRGTNGPSLQNGKLLGTTEKFPTDPARYPDPRERLANEQRLQRFGFKENYELGWDIGTSSYTTIDNIRMTEPKFTLDLIHVVHDEATGERTGGRFVEYRMILHEDPDTALLIARQSGINVDGYSELDFLNEMRYLQMRDWLIECFYKPTSTPQKKHKEMVINGKLVDYYEVNDENPTTIPFDQLNTRA